MMDYLADLHFLRPEWFYALLPFALLLWLLWRKQLISQSWKSVVSPSLLPHLLIGESNAQRPWNITLVMLAGLLGIIAMAGPAWQKLEVPVFRQPSALVVVLDLSRSMDATDIKPSRLARAKMKLRDILDQQQEGETALIVYAASAFLVSPLTSDVKTIASQLGSLSTDLMPAQGSRPDHAIALALQVLQQSGVAHGGVLLMSDGLDGDDSDVLQQVTGELIAAGHQLSVIGVGTPEGAPIATPRGGFLKDRQGAIVLPRLNDKTLEALALQGNGRYRRISTEDSDVRDVLKSFENSRSQLLSRKAEGINSDQWRDEGPWLVLPLLLLAALAFRRGYIVMVFLLVLPIPRPAQALDWQSLWNNGDQLGQQAMQADDPDKAATLFDSPEWRAAANYRAGNFQQAAEALKEIVDVDAYYNRGNALAKQGDLPAALESYEDALKLDPDNEDAKFNRNLVEELLKQKSQSQSDQQRQNGQDQSGEEQQQDEGDQGQQPEDDGQQGQQSDSKASGSETSGSETSGSETSGSESSGSESSGSESSGSETSGSETSDSSTSESESGQQTEQQNSNQASDADQHDAQQEEADQQDGQSEKQQLSDAEKATSEQGDNPEKAAGDSQGVGELQQADQQWLRRIPDDPGGLWRRKFLHQYKQQKQQGKGEEKAW